MSIPPLRSRLTFYPWRFGIFVLVLALVALSVVPGLLCLVLPLILWPELRKALAPEPIRPTPASAPVMPQLLAEIRRLQHLNEERSGELGLLRLLESAVVHARDAVLVLESEPQFGPGRSVLYANPAFSTMSGYELDEVHGRSLHFLRGPGTDEQTLDELRAALDQGRVFKGELLNYRKDGSSYWAELSVVPVPDLNGQLAHWVMIQRDISERKQADLALRKQDRILRAIIDCFPGSLNAKDCDGRYLVMNRFEAELYNKTPDEVIGKTVEEIHTFLNPQLIRARDELIIQSGMPLRFEEQWKLPEGVVRDWLAFKVPLPGEPLPDGTPVVAGVVTTYLDITEQKQIQETLRASEATLADAQRIAQLGSFDFFPETGTFNWSDQIYRNLGLEPQCVPATLEFFKTVLHPDDRDEVLDTIAERIKNPQNGILEYRIIRPTGEIRDIYTEYYYRPNGDGIFRFSGISQDVTERRLAEQKFLQAQKMELVGQMAGGIAHDFNNLLTAIIGNLNLVHPTTQEPSTLYVDTALKAANRAADLTRKLLGFARKNQLSVSPVSVRELVTETYDFVSRTFDPSIQVETEVLTESQVSVDITLISQVLLNLCINARDALPNGGTIRITAENVDYPNKPDHVDAQIGEFVRVSVIDTGEGMTEEVRGRIFEPFFTTKPVGKGTGLGLAMVQGTMLQHKGWVECLTTVGQGTRFNLYLPRITTAAKRKSGTTSWLSRQPAEIPESPTPQTRPATILLVDDEEMIRTIAKIVLENAGMTILEASDGDECVDLYKLHADQIDLVILDLTMPRVSGREACRKIRAVNPRARVLFSSGFSSEDVEPEDGAIGLLAKPYRPDDLLQAVQLALRNDPDPG